MADPVYFKGKHPLYLIDRLSISAERALFALSNRTETDQRPDPMPAGTALVGVADTGIRIVNRVLSCEHVSISRSIVMDWDAKRLRRSPAGEKIELRADLCSWPQWERRFLEQKKRLSRMLAGANGVLLAISLGETAGMEELLEPMAYVVREQRLVPWAVVTMPSAWESEPWHAGIDFPLYTGGGIVILPEQSWEHPEGGNVTLLHPSRQVEEVAAEILLMLSDGLFRSMTAASCFAGGCYYRAGIGRSADAVEAAGLALESGFSDECGTNDSGLVAMMVSGPDEMTSEQYSAAVDRVAKNVAAWNRFLPMRLGTNSTDRLVRVLILASGIRP